MADQQPIYNTDDLAERIIVRLSSYEQKRARRNIVLFSVLSVGSAIGAVFSWEYAQQAFTSSSFFQFFSLIFSDGKIVLANLGDYLWSLAESIPALNIALLLSSVLLCVVSAVFLISAIKRNYHGNITTHSSRRFA